MGIHEQFRPRLTPPEMIASGIFGGCYFSTRPEDWFELPKEWRDGLPEPINRLAKNNIYLAAHNKYKVKCGMSLQEWEQRGWINPQDPLGWFQWYCRYYQGRRTTDDYRQIQRWSNFIGRHTGMLEYICRKAGVPVSDVRYGRKTRQALLHWAWEV